MISAERSRLTSLHDRLYRVTRIQARLSRLTKVAIRLTKVTIKLTNINTHSDLRTCILPSKPAADFSLQQLFSRRAAQSFSLRPSHRGVDKRTSNLTPSSMYSLFRSPVISRPGLQSSGLLQLPTGTLLQPFCFSALGFNNLCIA
jgi:hypothetical protein